ncbi:MAG: hypothetical protein IIB60_01930 [Planctomycetes bacterium]|nr:hypothetical protein [Planctomycetota bacterium]
MGFISNRIAVVSTSLWERIRYGLPEVNGTVADEVLFVLDGVGGFQFAPLLIRRALRLEGSTLPTVLFHWQFCLPGEIWTDLMWYRRNRLMGLMLARRLLAFRRAHPKTRIHLLAYSGGAGVGVFACEKLKARGLIDTLVLACPALSPTYNLGPALLAVKQCYALVSHKDRWLLGLGTRIFGTTDRRFTAAAGMRGFEIPTTASTQDRQAYERMREIRWGPELKKTKHHGGHTGWVMVGFLRTHLLAILKAEPLLAVSRVKPAPGA